MKTTGFLIAACLVLGQAHCLDPEGVDAVIGLLGGYRNDRIGTTIKGYDGKGGYSEKERIFSDSLRAKRISIYEVGGYFDITVCREWILKTYATFGWIEGGNFKEGFRNLEVPRSISKGNVRSGNTTDFSIGGGYLFPFTYCVSVGPVAGWSYNYQKIRVKRVDTIGIADPLFDRLSYKMRWQGPWIGIQGRLDLCNVNVHGGYEYHWSHWRGRRSLSGFHFPECSFLDRHRSHSGYGNVVFFDVRRLLCGYWEIGVSLKYQFWEVSGDRRSHREKECKNENEENGDPADFIRTTASATWRSFEALLMLGFHF